MYQGVEYVSVQDMDDDYVTGYTVDDGFYCVTFDMQAARVLLVTSWKWKL